MSKLEAHSPRRTRSSQQNDAWCYVLLPDIQYFMSVWHQKRLNVFYTHCIEYKPWNSYYKSRIQNSILLLNKHVGYSCCWPQIQRDLHYTITTFTTAITIIAIPLLLPLSKCYYYYYYGYYYYYYFYYYISNTPTSNTTAITNHNFL